ncbi:MAG: cryptochrome/photolyase family protein [Actinobacteria bacterium]|nr:cryptochrome/photolyase family protein [Actinomycetota bacterium]
MTRIVWIQGTQLTPANSALAVADRTTDRVVLIESLPHAQRGRLHRHKVALVLTAMRRFAEELRADGWQVDECRLEHGLGFEEAISEQVRTHDATGVVTMAPCGWQAQAALPRLEATVGVPVHVTDDTQFLCSREAFADWAGTRRRLRMQEFYAWMRRTHVVLMDGEQPAGGQWSYDPDNRETFAAWKRSGERDRPTPPPTIDRDDPVLTAVQADIDRLLPGLPGRAEDFWLPTTRAESLAWLEDFIEHRLAGFGPFEDVSDPDDPWLRHATLSPLLNIGLLHPRECVAAAEGAYRSGAAPLASVEGFVRQVLGWREYVNGVYWREMPTYATLNELDAHQPVPPALTGEVRTTLACVQHVADIVERYAWTHHIDRLMIAGNLMLLLGTEPQAANAWFRERFADGYDWVMQANVTGMSLHADGGLMATKPYAAGGAYIKRMTGHCKSCRFDPKQRTGDDACPFTTLYWDFTARHHERLAANPRTAQAARGWTRFDEEEQGRIRARAQVVAAGIVDGTL